MEDLAPTTVDGMVMADQAAEIARLTEELREARAGEYGYRQALLFALDYNRALHVTIERLTRRNERVAA